MSGLHRDINVPRNFVSCRRLQKPRERTGGRSGPGAGCPPPPLGARPPLVANHVQPRGLCSIDIKDQGEPFNQCRSDLTAQIHLKRLYKQGSLAPRRQESNYSLAYFLERIQKEDP